jgi:predicted ATPase
MYRRLKLKNFKVWQNVDLQFGRVTGLFGPNSSGKTSLIQFLLLLKQTKDATDRALSLDLGGQYVMLGTYKDFVFRHAENERVRWSLSFEAPSQIIIPDPERKRTDRLVTGRQIRISSEVDSRNGAPRTRHLRYRIDKETYSLALKEGEETWFDLKATGEKEFRFVRTSGRPWQLPGPIKSYAFPDQVRTYYQNSGFLSDLEAAYEAQMDRTFYLGPLREYPRREYLWTRSRPSDVGQRGEKAIEAILAATAGTETRNLKPKARLKGFQEMIAYWLREMGLIFTFRVEEIRPGTNLYQAKVKVQRAGSEVLLTDVGFGVSQVLPVLTLLQYVPEGSTVILEQPEIHLHPLAQAGLADVISNVAEHRNVQVIVESHSEHFLLRLQRRVADETIPADHVKLYFCRPERGSAKLGASKLEDLELDLFGNVQNWPENFMGNAAGELAAATKARLRRQHSRAAE